MLKMDVKYEDFNGVQRNEEFYFNMSKSEMLRLQLRHSKLVDETTVQGGFTEFLESVRERGSGKEMGEVVEDLILSSYGQKSDDGRSFLKSAEARQAFSQTAAYDSLFIQLLTDQKAMETFFTEAFNIDKYDQDNQPSDKPNRPYPTAPAQHALEDTVPAAPPISMNNMQVEPTQEQIAEYLRNQQKDVGPEPMRG